MNRGLQIGATILKYLLGAFFIFSALSKFVEIDLLNIYIFSFNILSLNLSIAIGWILVSVELVLGVALLSNKYHRWVCVGNLLLLICFTLFLVFAQILGRTDNCHCMGDLFPFTPVQSMLKNAVLIVLLLFVWKYANGKVKLSKVWRNVIAVASVVVPMVIIALAGFMGWISMTWIDLQYTLTLAACVLVMALVAISRWAKEVWVQLLVALTPFVAIFILSTASNWIYTDMDSSVNKELFANEIKEDGSLSSLELNNDRKVVMFFSQTCSYCRMASQKISAIQQRNDLNYEDFVVVFPENELADNSVFYQESTAIRYNEIVLNPTTCIQITYGQFPLILLVDHGEIVSSYSHSDISEKAVVEFLK